MVSELLALAECALFTSGVPVTLESAELVWPEQLAGRGLLLWTSFHGHRALGMGMALAP